MSQYKEHVEEEVARLKSAGSDPYLMEVVGPKGLNFKDLQRGMTESWNNQVLKSGGR